MFTVLLGKLYKVTFKSKPEYLKADFKKSGLFPLNQSAVPASKIKLSETEEPGCSSNSVTHSSPPATSPSTPASTSNLLPSTPATPRSAMQKALIEVIQPQESNTTRRAL